jgi:hypothetical protein
VNLWDSVPNRWGGNANNQPRNATIAKGLETTAKVIASNTINPA